MEGRRKEYDRGQGRTCGVERCRIQSTEGHWLGREQGKRKEQNTGQDKRTRKIVEDVIRVGKGMLGCWDAGMLIDRSRKET